MGNVTLLVASIAFLTASGLATWLWFTIARLDDELCTLDGLDGTRLVT